MEIPPPPTDPPRRVPSRALPAYRFVPGLQPHPLKHPDGHMAHETSPPQAWSPQTPWSEDVDYLYGCDLFDHRYLWEAHEVWEGIWRQVPTSSALRSLLQGLIQSAAAILKAHVQQDEGAARLHQRSRDRLLAISHEEGRHFHGLDLP